MIEISIVVNAAAALASKVDALADAAMKLGELVQKKGNKDLNQQFFDLQSQINGVKEDIRKLKQEIEDLGQVDKGQYQWKDNMYWRKSDGDGPFCPTCFDNDGKAIHLQPDGASGNFHCGICKGQFSTPKAESNLRFGGRPSRFNNG